MLIYALLGCSWILFSDTLVEWFIADVHVAARVSIAKGWGFIAVTSVLLWMLIRTSLRKVEEIAAQHQQEKDAKHRLAERLSLAAQAAVIGIWDWDVLADDLQWNDEMFRLYGLPRTTGRAVGEAWRKALHPEDAERVQAERKRAVQQAGDVSSEYRILSGDGTTRTIAAFTRTICDQQGRPLRQIGVNYDITERKATEELLRRVNRELRAISSCTQALVRADNEVALLGDVCRIICEQAGYRLAWAGFAERDAACSVAPVSWHWNGPPGDYPATAHITWADTDRGRGPTGICIRTGATCYIQDFATDPAVAPWREIGACSGFLSSIALPLKDERGAAFAALNIYAGRKDAFSPEEIRLLEELAGDLAFGIISLRHRSERLRTEAQLRLILDTMPISAGICAADGTILYLNRKMLQTFGYSHADIPTIERWKELAYPEVSYRREAEATWNALTAKAIAEQGAIEDREYNVTCKDGRIKATRIFGIPIADKLFVLFEDITARKAIDERLRRSEKMEAIGQLAGGIAHDFNNQLSGILGFAEILALRLNDPALRHYAENIQRGALRSADLTRQLLAFSRSGKILSVPVGIHDVINETVSLLEHSIDKRVVIRRHLHADRHLVLGDPSQLQSALLNLGINARDAMPDGGVLTFATAVCEWTTGSRGWLLASGRYLQLRVTDTGKGMTPEVKAHLFEPFFTTKEPGKGTGLGLAAVYGAVTSHGGDIQVVSQSGAGTTFTIHLPLQEDEERRDPGIGTETILGSAHILIVDDEELLRELLTLNLEELGYRVTGHGDGEQAIAFYRQSWQGIDLVILDMVMPKLGGSEVFAALRTINPEVKVLLASGFSLGGDAQSLLEAGVKGFVQKPFLAAELSKKVYEVLRS